MKGNQIAMKMPEGYNRLIEMCKRYKSISCLDFVELYPALGLMKEMGEFLELLTQDMDISSRTRLLRLKKYENTFKRFKEWK